MKNKATYSEIALVVITIIWGLGFPITRLAINDGFQPYTIMVARFTVATVFLGIIYIKKLPKLNKKYLVYGSITGIFMFFGFYFQTVGNVYTTVSKNGFITQLNIIFVPYLYFLFFRKKVDSYNVLGIIIAVIGMFIMTYSKTEFTSINKGDIYTLICAVMVAFHVVTGSYFQKKHDFDPALFIIVNIAVSGLLSLILMMMYDKVPMITIHNVWPLVFLGTLNTAVGFVVQGYALKYSLPTRVALIVTLESVFSAFGAVLIIHEVLTAQTVIGGLLIITAVIMSEIKPFSKKLEIH